MSTDEIETKARSMGWLPKEEFRGDESRFIEAADYVARGETFVPFLKASNRELTNRLSETESKLRETQTLLQSSAAAIEELKNFRTALAKEKVVDKQREIRTALKEAKEAGDVDREVELTEQLSDTKAALREAEKTPVQRTEVAKEPEITPEGKAWLKENDWFGKDLRKTGLAQGLSAEWKASGKVVGTQEYFDHIDSEMAKIFDPNAGRRNRTQKVEGGSAGDSSRESGGGKTFADLPTEAKDACKRMADKLVGKGKAYETLAQWQKAYVETYDWS